MAKKSFLLKGKRWVAAVSAVALVGFGAVTVAVTAQAAGAGSIEVSVAPSAEVGEIDYAVYLPPGYGDSTDRYASVYLLHGRGDSLSAWQRVSGQLDDLINAGKIQPMIVVMPNAPWNDGGNWYTDSKYTGTAAGGPGLNVETAITRDLVGHIDDTYRTVDSRDARGIGGYSMGGAGALQMTLGHQELFSAGLLLSTAAYNPEPPADSSTRDYGAYGVGSSLYDQARYLELSYPTAFAAFDQALPLHLFIAVGDDEYANPDPAEAIHDIDFESAKLYNQARRVPGISAELRILDGGHDWTVWEPGFVAGIMDLNDYLRVGELATWDAELIGTSGDDRAGGIVEWADGSTSLGFNVASELSGIPYMGRMDAVIQKRDVNGAVQWSHVIGTPADDRIYGVVAGTDGVTITAGYTKGDLDGAHGTGEPHDPFVAAISASGERLWTTQFGDPIKTDRIYGITAGPDGGVYVTGYTSGIIAGDTNAGDKDVFVALVNAQGEIVWTEQFGSSGEDKGQAVSIAPDGGVYVAGLASGAMPGSTHAGSGDGFIAHFSVTGECTWLNQFGTSSYEHADGLVTGADGSVVAIGNTEGAIGEASLGDADAFARAYDATGSVLWTTQFGTEKGDRGVTGTLQPDGSVMIVGTTSGTMDEPVGGVDIFTALISPTGEVGAPEQFGSVETDGTDGWDANLYAAPGNAAIWITGLTYGRSADFTNSGEGDVFVERRSAEVDTPTEEPTVEPTAEPTVEPTADTDKPTTGDGTLEKDLADTGVNTVSFVVGALALLIAGAAVVGSRHTLTRQ